MATKKFTVTLKGTEGGKLPNAHIKLGGRPITLTSYDGEVTWTNNGIEIAYTPPLTIYIKVGGIPTTAWDISVKEKDATTPCFTTSGKIGDQPGISDPRHSIRETTSTC